MDHAIKTIWDNEISKYLNFISNLPEHLRILPYDIKCQTLNVLFSTYLHQSYLDDFFQFMSINSGGNFQDRTITSLFQCPGAGKTKICVSLAQRQPGIIIRDFFKIQKNHDILIETIERGYKRAVQSNRLGDFFKESNTVVEIFVFSYIEFYLRFIDYGKKIIGDDVYDVATRYFMDNGLEYIFYTFTYNLTRFQKKTHSYYNFCLGLMKQCVKCELFICFDEVESLKDQLIGYFIHTRYNPSLREDIKLQKIEVETGKPIKETGYDVTNLLFAFTLVAENLVREGVPAVIIGTHDSTFSALRNERRPGSPRNIMRFNHFIHLPMITKEDMNHYFKNTFGIELNEMDYFVGRPLFFSYLLKESFKVLRDKHSLKQEDLPEIERMAKQKVLNIVSKYYGDAGKIEAWRYYFNLHAGMIEFPRDQVVNEVDMGLARIVLFECDDIKARLIEKPITERLLDKESTPDDDLVFRYLYQNDFSTHQRSKYIIARLFIKDGTRKMKEWFNGTYNTKFENVFQDDRIQIEQAGNIKEYGAYIGKPYLYNISFDDYFNPKFILFHSHRMGPDLITSYRDMHGHTIPITIQIKNKEDPLSENDVLACLKSLHPKAFYEKKEAFLEWWHDHPSFFKKYIRIIVSYSGFSKEALEMISAINRENESQPVIIVDQFSEKDIGANLMKNDELFKKKEINRPDTLNDVDIKDQWKEYAFVQYEFDDDMVEMNLPKRQKKA